MITRLAMMRTRPGVCSSEPNAFGDDVIGVRSGTVRLTTIFKMADFDLPRRTTDNIDLMLLRDGVHADT